MTFWSMDLSALAGGLMTAASMTACPTQPPATVEVLFNSQPPKYSNALTTQDLGRFSVDTVISRHSKEVFMTRGITSGKIGVNYHLQYKTAAEQSLGIACLWIANVSVALDYAPDVYIASEYKPGSCRYRVTLEHEVRHVNTDVITVNEFLPQFKTAVQAALANSASPKPFPVSQVTQEQERLTALVQSTIEATTKKMDEARFARQQTIDTRQEYMRLSRACPGEAP